MLKRISKQLIFPITCLTIIVSMLACSVDALPQVLWRPKIILTGSPEDGGNYGRAVAVDKDTMVISAPNYTLNGSDFKQYNAGAAYVYTHSGTSWRQQAKLVADDASAGDGFGFSLAMSGDTIVVTVRFKAAYVFQKSGSTWVQQAKLVSPAHTDRNFASAVAIDGNTIVIGSAGAAYIYERDSITATWSYQANLLPQEENTIFGSAVAISGNTIVVGRGETGNSVDVFIRSSHARGWTHQASLLPEPTSRQIGFGHSVAIDGNTIIVGASSEPKKQGIPCTGSAYVFVRTQEKETWLKQARLVPRGERLGVNSYATCFPSPYGFGTSTAIDGNIAVIGARAVDPFSSERESAAYVFERDQSDEWLQISKILPPRGDNGRISSVSISDDEIVLGDIQALNAQKLVAGAAYVLDVNTVSAE